MRNLLLLASIIAVSANALATTIGVSTHPFTMKKQAVTAEYDNYSSVGAGQGVSVRYYHKINDGLNFDAGIGLTNGDRENRIFGGADYVIIPDYGTQPRISVKALAESALYAEDRIYAFGVAPTVSKGFSFWGHEGFPFVALPYKVELNDENSSYVTSTALAIGITAKLPIPDYDKLIGNLETNINIDNSYTAIVLGVTLPIF